MSPAANILVVDDEESMRIGCAQALAEEGHRVRTAENGQRALALIDRESFDVILLDLKMPGIPGMDVLRRIKESDPTSIVIVITGHATVDVAVEAMREGAYDFITKPFTPEALAAAVDRATSSRRRLLDSIREGKHGVRCQHAALRFFAGFPAGDFGADDAIGLPGSHTYNHTVFNKQYGV